MILNIMADAPAQMPPIVGQICLYGGCLLLIVIMKYFSWRIAR